MSWRFACKATRPRRGGPIITQWDAHKDLVFNHEKMCGHTDQPIAALLQDLKQRGLLDSTLVIWGSEFGRLPMSQSGNGRDHNPHGFTMWFAGGGSKGGRVIGETDELGLRGVGDRYPMRDFHATILHLLGMDQNRLWFLHNGRNEGHGFWREGDREGGSVGRSMAHASRACVEKNVAEPKWGRMASCGRLAIGLLELLLHRKAGRLTIGRRMPSCPTSAQIPHVTPGDRET
jgi:hypothetical protein